MKKAFLNSTGEDAVVFASYFMLLSPAFSCSLVKFWLHLIFLCLNWAYCFLMPSPLFALRPRIPFGFSFPSLPHSVVCSHPVSPAPCFVFLWGFLFVCLFLQIWILLEKAWSLILTPISWLIVDPHTRSAFCCHASYACGCKSWEAHSMSVWLPLWFLVPLP